MLSMHKEVVEVKRRLVEDRKHLNDLPDSINGLTHSINDFKKLFSKAIPIEVVGWMFGILVLTIVGVEAAQWLFKEYLIK